MTIAQTLFLFKGRINRAKYWLIQLLMLVTIFSTYISWNNSDFGGVPIVIIILFGVISTWISLAIQIKRWHDRNKSGWWVFIELIPFIGNIWAFVELGCLKGTAGENRFGPDPLERS